MLSLIKTNFKNNNNFNNKNLNIKEKLLKKKFYKNEKSYKKCNSNNEKIKLLLMAV